ncbi:MAG: hypothetical protein IMF19_15295 [Proteobacteria bacterium]|nr:hypothetical protein [Pseudomonadota bacterium]
MNMQQLKAWHKDPLLFVTEAIDWEKDCGPSPQQAEALKKFPDTKRMTIESDYGCGKDAVAAWLSLWYVVTRRFAKVIVVGATIDQPNDIFSLELLKWFKRSKLQSEFIYQDGMLFQKDSPKEWYVRLVSPDEDNPAELLAGYCSEHLLVIANDASGIPDIVFAPLDSVLTGFDSKVLLLGRMNRDSGYFFNSNFKKGVMDKWTKLSWLAKLK